MDRLKGFAEACMADYDIDGWNSDEFISNLDVSYHANRNGSTNA